LLEHQPADRAYRDDHARGRCGGAVIETQRDELRKRTPSCGMCWRVSTFRVSTSRRIVGCICPNPGGRRFRPHLPSARRRRSSADAFAVGREVLAHAVRINLSAAPSLGELRQALSIIAEVLNSGHFEISGAV